MTISETILRNLPYLNPITDADKVTAFRNEVLIIMQNLWLSAIPDLELLDEASYTEKQKLLVAYYACFNMITEKSIQTIGGIQGEQATDQRIITQESAGAVSVSYKVVGKSEGFGTDVEMMLKTFREKACSLAFSMGISLPICILDTKQQNFIPVYFKPDAK